MIFFELLRLCQNSIKHLRYIFDKKKVPMSNALKVGKCVEILKNSVKGAN